MLSALVFFPLVFGLILFLFPEKFLSRTALIGACLQFLLSCSLFFLFDPSRPEIQMKEIFELIPFFGVNYFLALDGLSFWYVLLSAFLLPLVVLFSFNQKSPLYFFLLFSLVTLSNGVFLSFDGILFYIFFELSLLPLFFLIFLWGGEKRVYASFKFLIYTFFASLFLLGGLITMMLMNKAETGQISASLLDFYNLDFVFIGNQFLSAQALLFFCFAFAFAVKTPLMPFHTWLPLAHVEAPTG
ncbi:MAG: proton-conducting transporter membrane subunit, partial [Oligoflexia bacterium]|nr:proton-conducting transporter membrane subunit [Oligoflexia bacterium]